MLKDDRVAVVLMEAGKNCCSLGTVWPGLGYRV